MPAYEVHLKQFDGPLDLLLHLIEQAEVDIKDIFISEITAQYIDYMRGLDELDMDTASEFLTMAATLVYIKSRSLMPRPPRETEPEEDPAETLIRQLREYKAAKEAGRRLEALYAQAQGVFAKLPEEFILPPQEVIWAESSADELFAAFFDLLHRQGEARQSAAAVHEVQADDFTVRRQLVKLRALLGAQGRVAFDGLFAPDAPKMEIIVTFMALLDMLTRGEVRLRQSVPYGPIAVEAASLLGEDGDELYMDEE